MDKWAEDNPLYKFVPDRMDTELDTWKRCLGTAKTALESKRTKIDLVLLGWALSSLQNI